MSAGLGPSPRFLALDSQGNPGAGCKLYTYAAGTSTPQTTYSDYGGTIPNTNPVVFDSRGEAKIYFTPGVGYKLVLKDSSDVTLRTDDDYYAINPALFALAGLTFAANNLILLTGANAAAVGQLTDAYVAVGNKDGVAATASMRTLGTGAQQAAAGNHTHSHTALTDIGTNTHAQIDTHIASAANPHAVTKTQVGLGNADNTSDAAKPVSTAAQTALNLKANDNAVPHLTGNESIGGVKSFTDMVKFSRGVQVASAAALNLSNEDGIYFNVTGTTGITSLSTRGATGTGAAKGILPLVILKFDGILTLTHSASLILPGAADITTYAGLVLTFVEESAGAWRCIGQLIMPNNMRSSIPYTSKISLAVSTTVYNITSIMLPAGKWQISGGVACEFTGISGSRVIGITATSATLPSFNSTSSTPNNGEVRLEIAYPNMAQTNVCDTIPTYEYSSDTDKTLFLFARGYFTSGAANAWGYIEARRIL